MGEGLILSPPSLTASIHANFFITGTVVISKCIWMNQGSASGTLLEEITGNLPETLFTKCTSPSVIHSTKVITVKFL